MTSVPVWQDREKRRALLLSFLIHALILLWLAWSLNFPEPVLQENFIVLDLGTPTVSETVVEAPAAVSPAAPAPTPQVADVNRGVPRSNEAQPAPSGPEPVVETPAPPASTPAEPQDVAEAEVPPVSPPPLPSLREPAPQATTLPPIESPPSTALPEIAEVELAPKPLAQAVLIPKPQPDVTVPEARTITAQPAVQVAAERSLPTPQVEARLAAARTVPTPQVATQVATARSVPTPQVRADAGQARAIPQPQVDTSVAAAREILDVQPQVNVAQARSVEVEPRLAVSRAAPVAVPDVAVSVTPPPVDTPSADATAQARSDVQAAAPSGGNAEQAGQTRVPETAETPGPGLAASPEGSPQATGAPARRPREAYQETRSRPLAVILDNARGYPQSGLGQASAIYEMPVEGGLTRLMAVFDRVDPSRVGPVRSARDYFLETAQGLNGILVHDGGSPSALAKIIQEDATTFNAYERGDLFARADSRGAPYNLYTQGSILREAVNRLSLERRRTLSGEWYRPPQGTADSRGVQIDYSAAYRSGFDYLPNLNLYRWLRQGERAVDSSGEAVYVDAVLVASIEAQPIPDDPEGRLYIPLRGGEATLYLAGKRIDGRWSPRGGLEFSTASGEVVDLSPYKVWVVYKPQWSTVSE